MSVILSDLNPPSDTKLTNLAVVSFESTEKFSTTFLRLTLKPALSFVSLYR